MTKLYLVHCGYYDPGVCGGLYESHASFMVAAASFEDARARAKSLAGFQAKRMHVDGMQEIEAVDGCRVVLEPAPELEGATLVRLHNKRELAPSSPSGA